MKEGNIKLSNEEQLFFYECNTECLGKEPSLVFVHGNTSSSESWRDTIEHIQKIERHIIAVDLRGFGRSSYKNPCTRYGHWAEDIKELCNMRGIKKCIVNGWSFGGGVSMKLAQIAPDLVQKLILTCSAPHTSIKFEHEGKIYKTSEELKTHPHIAMMMAVFESNNWQALLQSYNKLFFSRAKDYPEERKEAVVKAAIKERCYLHVSEAIANSDIDIEKIKAETLMIHGAQDPLVPRAMVEPTGTNFKNFVVWQNNGHYIPGESPKQYEELILKFAGRK